jgi:ubiquinone biosynthesis protein
LGPIFVKFGQLLATRRDILPDALAEDLTHLQEAVTPFPGAQTLIEAALGEPVSHFFKTFDPNPFAAASVAQVHAATLDNGEAVVIKILRPGIEQQVGRDLQLLHWLAKKVTHWIPELRRFHLNNVIDQYDQIIHNELDLRKEAKNGQQFANNFRDSNLLYVPKVYPQFTRQNLLVLERVYGIPIDQTERLKAKGVDLKKLSAVGVEIFFSQVFRDNFFHADMHPGNIHVDVSDPNNPRYLSLDSAIVGSLDERDQLLLGRKLLALLRQDFLGVAQLMVTGHWVPSSTDTRALANTLSELLTPILTQSLADMEFGPLLVKLFQAAREFDLQALPQFMLLEKTLIHVEGLGKQLDPSLDIFAIGQPLLEAWLKQKIGPGAILQQFEKAIPRWLEQIPQLPTFLETLVSEHHKQRAEQSAQLKRLVTMQHKQAEHQLRLPLKLTAGGILILGLHNLTQGSPDSPIMTGSMCLLLGATLFWLGKKPTLLAESDS